MSFFAMFSFPFLDLILQNPNFPHLRSCNGISSASYLHKVNVWHNYLQDLDVRLKMQLLRELQKRKCSLE